jgi:ketosteroid isomerase-like protein
MPGSMDADATISFANDSFYAAFAGRDLVAMDKVWARTFPASCIHPGWNPIIGRERVMESWRAILTNPSLPPIICRQPVVRRLGDTALVICFEVILESTLAATNAFVREDGEWRLVHHQAGPLNVPPPAELSVPVRMQ